MIWGNRKKLNSQLLFCTSGNNFTSSEHFLIQSHEAGGDINATLFSSETAILGERKVPLGPAS